MSDRKFISYKFIVIGDVGIGKTCIIKRYVHDIFTEYHKSTIGVDFALKVLDNETEKVTIKIQLWDITGQERFGNMTRVYYRDAIAAIIVFDINCPSSLENVKRWKEDVDNKVTLPGTDQKIPAILLANKVDMVSSLHENIKSELDILCKDLGMEKWFATSAKTGDGIEEAFDFIVNHVYNMPFSEMANENNSCVDLTSTSKNTEGKEDKCSCF